MQLNAVVLPAPLGPINPTISYSPTSMGKSCSAGRPPKRMPTSRTSSTDIRSHLASRVVVPVQGERSARHPAGQRPEQLPQPAGASHHGVQQQDRADQTWEVALPVDVEVGPADRLEEVAQHVVE